MQAAVQAFRWGKIVAVAGLGLMAFLITFGNITDYYSNYYFVEHVMKMDTIFPASGIHYRAIQSPVLYNLGYILIITLEAFMAICCCTGAWLMYKNRRAAADNFHAAKKWAVYGLITGIGIWFIGFEVIGGEWFAMWQSEQWNGLTSADRILTFISLTFIALQLKEE
jgi:predicted small integral membrane protein